MGRLPRRNLGAGVYHIYNRCANNLWILDSPERNWRHSMEQYID